MATTVSSAGSLCRRPEGYPSTVSTYLVCRGAAQVVDFMSDVFGASTSRKILNEENGTVKHALMCIDACAVMIGESSEEYPPIPTFMHVYVEDVDATYELALSKGAVSVKAPKDECYGDRAGAVRDVGGNTWWIATNKFTPDMECGLQSAECIEAVPG